MCDSVAMIASEQDIMACFRLLLGREPTDQERPGHFGMAGNPLESVVASYLESLEFRHRGLLASRLKVKKVALCGYQVYISADDPLVGAAIATSYEPEVTGAFLEHIGAGAVLDIGANCGYYTLLARQRGVKVFAFEPFQPNVQLLHATLAENRLDGIQVFAAAASDRPGTLVIGGSYMVGIVNDVRASNAQAALGAEYAAAVRVDDMIPANEPVSLIKIDVEGHEYRTMMGAQRTILRSRPVIISELAPHALEGNSGRTAAEYLQLLRGWGYAVSVIRKPEIQTDEAILKSAQGMDHVDLLAVPCS